MGGHSYPLGQEDLKNLPRSFHILISGASEGTLDTAHVLTGDTERDPGKWLGASELAVAYETRRP